MRSGNGRVMAPRHRRDAEKYDRSDRVLRVLSGGPESTIILRDAPTPPERTGSPAPSRGGELGGPFPPLAPGPRPFGRLDRGGASFFGPGLTSFTKTSKEARLD